VKILGIVWAVVTNLVALLIFTAAVDKTNTPFEKIVIASLFLIYLNVTLSLTFVTRTQIEMRLAQVSEVVDLRRLLNDPKASDVEEELTENRETYAKTTTKFWINAVFAWVFFVIAVVMIVTA
jgi:hypothetical protein